MKGIGFLREHSVALVAGKDKRATRLFHASFLSSPFLLFHFSQLSSFVRSNFFLTFYRAINKPTTTKLILFASPYAIEYQFQKIQDFFSGMWGFLVVVLFLDRSSLSFLFLSPKKILSFTVLFIFCSASNQLLDFTCFCSIFD